MQITNQLGLPAPIVAAVANDGYTRGHADISMTQLIAPPRKVALEELHRDEITEDASDRIWSLLGQSIHTILERAAQTEVSVLTEKRLFMEIGGWRVSAGLDRFVIDTGRLDDYKVTSVWAISHGAKDEWVHQLNGIAHLLRHNAHRVDGLGIIAILRDWSRTKARQNPAYPEQQIVRIPIPLWSPQVAAAYLEGRVRLHREARVSLPDCTDSERWLRYSKWAVVKGGATRASKLFDKQDDAERFAAEKGDGYTAGYRKGEYLRCQSYCSAAPFCSQWQAEKPPEQPEKLAGGGFE